MAFVVRHGQLSVGAETHAIGVPHSGGEDFEFLAVLGYFQQSSLVVGPDARRPGGGLSVIKIPILIS